MDVHRHDLDGIGLDWIGLDMGGWEIDDRGTCGMNGMGWDVPLRG